MIYVYICIHIHIHIPDIVVDVKKRARAPALYSITWIFEPRPGTLEDKAPVIFDAKVRSPILKPRLLIVGIQSSLLKLRASIFDRRSSKTANLTNTISDWPRSAERCIQTVLDHYLVMNPKLHEDLFKNKVKNFQTRCRHEYRAC